ncbi:TOBE domain-containing protein [Iamia sp.]|uniref:TOBE domain-containing protein n=1 Tax=Iamia sp. TaxID=2722710 RepID=UPI002BFB7DF0|nr:TOBE domain-containing protein [Iamia sp.]HXH56850.1 TOBE domain-containing protein [Iamia sp.]
MTSLTPGQVADLTGVSVDTVRRWSDDGRLATSRDARGRRSIDGADLARFLVDQAGTGGPPTGLSARNRFRGIVTRVTRDGVAATVEIQAGPHRIVSLITSEAVDELGLAPGIIADAAVKATDVMVDVAPL